MALEASCRVDPSGNLVIKGGASYLRSQILRHLGILHDLRREESEAVDSFLPVVLEKIERCWLPITSKYYRQDGKAVLDINHSNQYCQLLLILAHEASMQGHKELADKIFGLNKMMNACDIYHEIALPACFYIDHTLGVVLGRAKYGERLYLSQNCTIGSNPCDPRYPEFGDDNFLMANVTIIGTVKTGNRVIFATGTYIKDMEIPDNSLVFGRMPDIIVKPLSQERFAQASPFMPE